MTEILCSMYGHLPNRWATKYNKEGQRYDGIVEIIGGENYWGHINRFNTNYTALTHAKYLLDLLYHLSH